MPIYITSRLKGTLYGTIWMPPIKATLDVSVDLTQTRDRYVGGHVGTFRHAMVSIANDGNFQSSNLTRDSVIVIQSERVVNGVFIRRSKTIPITRFKSIKDLIHPRHIARH